MVKLIDKVIARLFPALLIGCLCFIVGVLAHEYPLIVLSLITLIAICYTTIWTINEMTILMFQVWEWARKQ